MSTVLLCVRCIGRGLKKPRHAVTILSGDALCKDCVDRRIADAKTRATVVHATSARVSGLDRKSA